MDTVSAVIYKWASDKVCFMLEDKCSTDMLTLGMARISCAMRTMNFNVPWFSYVTFSIFQIARKWSSPSSSTEINQNRREQEKKKYLYSRTGFTGCNYTAAWSYLIRGPRMFQEMAKIQILNWSLYLDISGYTQPCIISYPYHIISYHIREYLYPEVGLSSVSYSCFLDISRIYRTVLYLWPALQPVLCGRSRWLAWQNSGTKPISIGTQLEQPIRAAPAMA